MALTTGWKLWPDKGIMGYGDPLEEPPYWDALAPTFPVMDAEWAGTSSTGRAIWGAPQSSPVATSVSSPPGSSLKSSSAQGNGALHTTPTSSSWAPRPPPHKPVPSWEQNQWASQHMFTTSVPLSDASFNGSPSPYVVGVPYGAMAVKPTAVGGYGQLGGWGATGGLSTDLYSGMRQNHFTQIAPMAYAPSMPSPPTDLFHPPVNSPVPPTTPPLAYGSSGDWTVGHSDSSVDQESAQAADLDAQLISCILDYFGDCKGSLPSERVQNIIKKEHRELYDAVFVSARFGKKWHKFLNHYSDTFQLFTVPSRPTSDQDYCWRIRLTNNPNWEEADQQEDQRRALQEKAVLEKLHAIISSHPNKECPMAEIIHELNKEAELEEASGKEILDEAQGERKTRKIRVNDLKRIMRKHPSGIIVREYHPDGNQQRCVTYLALEGAPENGPKE